jgi:hypothetical protein
MKHLVNLVGVAVLALSSHPALAQAKEQQAAPAASTPAQADQRLEKMQEQMRLMQSQMDKIDKTEDPQERHRLLEEHWNSMQKAMGTMMMGGQMGGGHKMDSGRGMGGPMMWKDYRELTPEQLRERQYMLDRWMPMHQMMMDQMMQHQHSMMQTHAAPSPRK